MYATKYILLTILFCVGVNVRGADAIQEFLNKQKAHQSFRLPQELVGRVTNPLSCSICMDSLTEGTLYKLPKVGLNCGHVFHHKCLDEWVREHLTCPMDREKVNENDYQEPLLSIADLIKEGWNIQVEDNGKISINNERDSFPMRMVNSLEGLDVEGSIVTLDLTDCFLKTAPNMSSLAALRILYLGGGNQHIAISEGSLPKNLQELILYDCKLETVPADVSKMEALRCLRLDGNNLSTIPKGSLPENLEKLYLSWCKLETVPADISKMEELQILYLSGNKDIAIPKGSLPENLEKLYLDYCRLNQVPADVSKMEALRFLNLDRNNLSTIPEGSLPKNLEKLYLGDCRLNQVPADVSKMEALLFLNLSWNDLIAISEGSLPKNLQELILYKRGQVNYLTHE